MGKTKIDIKKRNKTKNFVSEEANQVEMLDFWERNRVKGIQNNLTNPSQDRKLSNMLPVIKGFRVVQQSNYLKPNDKKELESLENSMVSSVKTKNEKELNESLIHFEDQLNCSDNLSLLQMSENNDLVHKNPKGDESVIVYLYSMKDEIERMLEDDDCDFFELQTNDLKKLGNFHKSKNETLELKITKLRNKLEKEINEKKTCIKILQDQNGILMKEISQQIAHVSCFLNSYSFIVGDNSKKS